MKNEIIIINEQEVLGKQFKIYGDFEEPLFLAKDVADWIEHSNPRVMLQTVDESEKVVNIVYTLGGNQESWFVTEDGLYEILMQSRKPIAKQFKKEVKGILKALRKTGTYSTQQQIPFKEQVECIDIIANSLRANDASKILMYSTLYKDYNLPISFLPQYELNGSKELKSATELLKKFDLKLSTIAFNNLMVANGYLEERTRNSRADITKIKKYKALTEKGLKYGENAVCIQCQKETQPLYYADTFEALFDIVSGRKELSMCQK